MRNNTALIVLVLFFQIFCGAPVVARASLFKIINHAVGSAATGVVSTVQHAASVVTKPVAAVTTAAVETIKVATGQQSVFEGAKAVAQNAVAIPTEVGKSAVSAAITAGRIVNTPLVVVKSGLETAGGKVGESVGNIITMPSYWITDGAVTIVASVGTLLRVHTPLEVNPLSLLFNKRVNTFMPPGSIYLPEPVDLNFSKANLSTSGNPNHDQP